MKIRGGGYGGGVDTKIWLNQQLGCFRVLLGMYKNKIYNKHFKYEQTLLTNNK